MTHDQLARRVATRTCISVRDARRVLDAVAAESAGALARGEPVTLATVGTLTPPRSPGGRTTFRSSRERDTAAGAGDAHAPNDGPERPRTVAPH